MERPGKTGLVSSPTKGRALRRASSAIEHIGTKRVVRMGDYYCRGDRLRMPTGEDSPMLVLSPPPAPMRRLSGTVPNGAVSATADGGEARRGGGKGEWQHQQRYSARPKTPSAPGPGGQRRQARTAANTPGGSRCSSPERIERASLFLDNFDASVVQRLISARRSLVEAAAETMSAPSSPLQHQQRRLAQQPQPQPQEQQRRRRRPQSPTKGGSDADAAAATTAATAASTAPGPEDLNTLLFALFQRLLPRRPCAKPWFSLKDLLWRGRAELSHAAALLDALELRTFAAGELVCASKQQQQQQQQQQQSEAEAEAGGERGSSVAGFFLVVEGEAQLTCAGATAGRLASLLTAENVAAVSSAAADDHAMTAAADHSSGGGGADGGSSCSSATEEMEEPPTALRLLPGQCFGFTLAGRGARVVAAPSQQPATAAAAAAPASLTLLVLPPSAFECLVALSHRPLLNAMSATMAEHESGRQRLTLEMRQQVRAALPMHTAQSVAAFVASLAHCCL